MSADEQLHPEAVARHGFDVTRRGFDQNEVRAYLHEVSQSLGRALRGESEWRERAERAETRLKLMEHPDEGFLLEVLGEETTRVLTSAREAAGEIRAKAEQSAGRLIAEAQQEATRVRTEVESTLERRRAAVDHEAREILGRAATELERRSAEAEQVASGIVEKAETRAALLRNEANAVLEQAKSMGEHEIEAARERGREMIAEAQSVRERVLKDLAARRRKAKLQVERLNAGRERLLHAYGVVRRTIDAATEELTVSTAQARAAAELAARRVEEESEASLAQLEAEIAAARLVDHPIVDPADTSHGADGSEPAVDGVEEAEHATAELYAVESSADDDDEEESPSLDEVPGASGPVRLVASGPMARRSGGRRRRQRDDVATMAAALPEGELHAIDPSEDFETVQIVEQEVIEVEFEVQTSGDDVEVTEVMTDLTAVAAGRAEVKLMEAPNVEPDDEIVDLVESTPDEEADLATELHATPTADDRVGEVEDLFARLRAERAESTRAPDDAADPEHDGDAHLESDPAPEELSDAPAVEQESVSTDVVPDAESGETNVEPSSDAAVIAERDAALAIVERELSKRLKRVLADEQNEVLDLLRRTRPSGVDDVLGDPVVHAKRWADASEPVLRDAASVGAASLEGTASGQATAHLHGEFGDALVGPLRERIERCFDAAEGDLDDVTDRVRTLYREWKGERLSVTIRQQLLASYAIGRFEAVDDGARTRWLVGVEDGCPDCADNELAGAVAKGEQFPTGHTSPPAHPGCRCVIVPEA